MEVITFKDALSILINTTITLAIPFVARELVRLLSAGVSYLKALVEERNPNILDVLSYVAKEAVAFAEQSGLDKVGQEKMEMAIAYAQRELDERGFGKVDVSLIAEKLEAALYTEINGLSKNSPLG